MKIAITAKTIYSNKDIYRNQTILIENGILTHLNLKEIPLDAKVLTCDILSSGFLDLQIYGAGKTMFSADLSYESLEEMETVLLTQGCTGFLATLATNSDKVFFKAIETAKTYQPKIGNFLGLHLEGPFINLQKRGAHISSYIKRASIASIKQIISHADGIVKMMTIAPELQSEEVIDLLNEANITLSVGHSLANFKEGIKFFDKIPAATHLFNAMPSLHHRDPGLIGAIFNKKPYTSIVADGVHVDFEMISMAKKLLHDKLFLITDAVTACNHGPYQHVFNKNHYTMPDGTLSGSALTMLQAIKNCVNEVGISVEEGIRMASSYPAELLSNNNYGQLNVGQPANLVLMDDDLKLEHVVFKSIILNANDSNIIKQVY